MKKNKSLPGIYLNLEQPDKNNKPNYFIDQFLNEYSQSNNLETWTCKLKADGSLGCGWTAEEAFQRASDYNPLIMMSPEKLEKANRMASLIKQFREYLSFIDEGINGKKIYPAPGTNIDRMELELISVDLVFSEDCSRHIILPTLAQQGLLELMRTQLEAVISNLKEEFRLTFAEKKE